MKRVRSAPLWMTRMRSGGTRAKDSKSRRVDSLTAMTRVSLRIIAGSTRMM